MPEPILRLGIGKASKRLYVEILGLSLWKLQKIDLLAVEPFMRCVLVDKQEATRRLLRNVGINWEPIPAAFGIVNHRTVVARIIKSMSLEEGKAMINQLATRREAGPIHNGFLSSEHGRLYLTAKDLGWGWRLQRRKVEQGAGVFYLERYRSKRVRPIVGDQVHLSVYASLLTPVSIFMDSLLRDFGSFADPFSLVAFKRKDTVIYRYVDIPLRNVPRQLDLMHQLTNEGGNHGTKSAH